MTTLHKKDDATLPSNYQPISIKRIVCKIPKKCDNLVQCTKSNEYFTDRQLTFLKGRSATLQIINDVDECSRILDSGGSIDTNYTDFQKAFDTAPHK